VKATLTRRYNGQWRIGISCRFIDIGLKIWMLFHALQYVLSGKFKRIVCGRVQNDIHHELVRRKYQHTIAKSNELALTIVLLILEWTHPNNLYGFQIGTRVNHNIATVTYEVGALHSLLSSDHSASLETMLSTVFCRFSNPTAHVTFIGPTSTMVHSHLSQQGAEIFVAWNWELPTTLVQGPESFVFSSSVWN
jgi:hypothetical protein